MKNGNEYKNTRGYISDFIFEIAKILNFLKVRCVSSFSKIYKILDLVYGPCDDLKPYI